MITLLRLFDEDYDHEVIKDVMEQCDALNENAGLAIEIYNKAYDEFNALEYEDIDNNGNSEEFRSMFNSVFKSYVETQLQSVYPALNYLQDSVNQVKDIEEQVEDKTFTMSKKIKKRYEQMNKRAQDIHSDLLFKIYHCDEEIDEEMLETITNTLDPDLLAVESDLYSYSELTQETIEAIWQSAGIMTHISDTLRILLGDYNDDF